MRILSIIPDERLKIARLFSFMIQGELLAHQCAEQQGQVFPEWKLRRFLNKQARQEYFHAKVFDFGIRSLGVKHVGVAPGKRYVQQYEMLLREAVKKNNFAESLLGMQVILEGMGEVMLDEMQTGFAPRQVEFRQVRRLVLGQEQAHHSFGLKQLEAMIGDDDRKRARLKVRAQEYLGLMQLIVREMDHLFEYFDTDPAVYWQRFQADLPAWIAEGI